MVSAILAHNARALRKAAGLTVVEAAEALQCNKTHLYRIEAKECSPGAQILAAMANLFGCPMESIISEEQPTERLCKLQAETLRRQARDLEAQAVQLESGRAVGL